MKLLNSSVFQFCMLILIPLFIVLLNTEKATWKDWMEWAEVAVYFVGIYAGKEGTKYAASAYKERGLEP